MEKMFNRFASEEGGNAVIDWTVLLAGMVLLTLSILLSIVGTDTETADATESRLEHVESMPG